MAISLSPSTSRFRDLRGPGEQVIVESLRTSATGVLDRKGLIDTCLPRGINENTLSVYTTYSPILEHLGLDLWKLRGVLVDPVSVEAVRSQNQLRPRETRLLDQGWTSEGKLWIAWRLPSTSGQMVLGVPGAINRFLNSRSFRLVEKESGKEFGNVSITEGGTSYGYGQYLRYIGADEGDTMLAEFDFATQDVEISLADSELLEGR